MREANLFPAELGLSGWFGISCHKTRRFSDSREILDQYDCIVVGGGFGGFGAARRFAECNPAAKIAVFEAIRIGNNDSGKNAGFLIDVPHAFSADTSTLEEKQWNVRLYASALEKMRAIIKDNNLPADWDECGKYLAAREPGAFKHLEREAGDLDAVGKEYRVVEEDELARTLGTRYYKRALFSPGSILVNPAAMLRGMFTVLPENVHVFEETPVLTVEDGPVPAVTLAGGRRVRCKAVIVTAGPWLEAFGLSGSVFCPVISFAAMTRELNEQELAAFKDVRPWGVTAAHPAGTSVRFTRDNRIMVRNGFMYPTWLSCSPERIRRARKMLRAAFNNRFPGLERVNFEYVWAGLIHLTMNAKPVFGRRGAVHYSSVGEGAGVAKTFSMGMCHAEWASGMDSDVLRFLRNDKTPGRLPPEPLRTLGAECRLVWERLRAKGEL